MRFHPSTRSLPKHRHLLAGALLVLLLAIPTGALAVPKTDVITLINGDVDAMVADSPFVQVWRNTHLEHYQKIAALLTPVTREYYAFAIRPGDPAFLNWLGFAASTQEGDDNGSKPRQPHPYPGAA